MGGARLSISDMAAQCARLNWRRLWRFGCENAPVMHPRRLPRLRIYANSAFSLRQHRGYRGNFSLGDRSAPEMGLSAPGPCSFSRWTWRPSPRSSARRRGWTGAWPRCWAGGSTASGSGRGAVRRQRLAGVRADGTWTLDVRLVLESDDGALIAMTYRGLRRPQGGDRRHRARRASSALLLFPHRRLLRDRRGQVCLAQRHRRRRCGAPATGKGPVYQVFEVL